MNTKLFNKVKKYIAAHPKELVMDYFCEFMTKELKQDQDDFANHSLSRLSCGTVGCIAGTGLYCSIPEAERPRTKAEYELFQNNHLSGFSGDEAAELFDIPRDEADALFYFPFREQEDMAMDENEVAVAYDGVRERLKNALPGTKKYANIVLEAIDICIDRCGPKKVVTPALTYQG